MRNRNIAGGLGMAVVEALEGRLLLSNTAFFEGWERAPLGDVVPSTESPASIIRGDAGHWFFDDTVGTVSGSTANRGRIIHHNGSKALRLEAHDSQSGAADNLWAWCQEILRWNRGFGIPITPGTNISFDAESHLDDPDDYGYSFNVVDDSVFIALEDNRGNQVFYALSRPDDAEPGFHGDYNEIFLDTAQTSFSRDLYADFAAIPEFEPQGAKIVSIVIEVPDSGWVMVDNLWVGQGSYTPPFVDLSLAMDSAKLPPAIIAGQAARVRLPVSITNVGTQAVDRGARLGVQVALRPVGATDSSQDVVIDEVEVPVSRLSAGRTRKTLLRLEIPPTLAEGEYRFVVGGDLGQFGSEPDVENNFAVATSTTLVAEPTVDLTVGLGGNLTLPGSLLAGQEHPKGSTGFPYR
jgi:hypothetical protein